MIQAIKEKNVEDIYKLAHNDFQRPVSKKNSKLKKVAKRLESLGLKGVCMSGSGTSIYGLTTDIELAQKIYSEIVFDYQFVKYGRIKHNLTKEDY